MEDYWLTKWREQARTCIDKKVEKGAKEYALPYGEVFARCDYKSIEYRTALYNITCGGSERKKLGFI